MRKIYKRNRKIVGKEREMANRKRKRVVTVIFMEMPTPLTTPIPIQF